MADLKDLVVRLHQGGVDFVLVGGFGAVALGSSLVTRDVDVVCRMDAENLLRLFTAFEPLHPVHRMTPKRLPFTRVEAAKGDLLNIYLSTDWGQLDCLGNVKGIGDYAACLQQSELLEIDGQLIQVLSLNALIYAKRAIGRPRDLHAVMELEAIRERSERDHDRS